MRNIGCRQHVHLAEAMTVRERYFLLIEGERVGPFIFLGRHAPLIDALHDRGVEIEVEREKSR